MQVSFPELFPKSGGIGWRDITLGGWALFSGTPPPPPSEMHGGVLGFPYVWLGRDKVTCTLLVAVSPLLHAYRTSVLNDGCLWLWGYYFQC